MIDSQEFIIKGMQRDLSVSKFNPEFAFENMNIRITARDNNTLLSVTNEKGNTLCGAYSQLNRITAEFQFGPTGKIAYAYFYADHPIVGKIELTAHKRDDFDGDLPDITIELSAKEDGRRIRLPKADYARYAEFSVTKQYRDGTSGQICYFEGDDYVQTPETSLNKLVVEGECIGKEVINDYLVLFTVSTEEDEDGVPLTKSNIYRLEWNGETFKKSTLYSGNLGFSVDHPIESIGVFENEDIQKVYWTDGLNQPRFINIVADSDTRKSWKDDSFNFVPSLKLEEEIKIEKIQSSSGMFPAGTVQYAFTYYNPYGQQSNIFYVSPLYYNSLSSRGGSPEDKVGTSYKINILKSDINFKYIRVYSIIRTSIDATPTVKRVVDVQTTTSMYGITFIDSNLSGDTVDPTELLYMGGEEAVFGCICQKDNTLFLGDIKLVRSLISKDNASQFKDHTKLEFGTKSIKGASPFPIKGYYEYSSQLSMNSFDITSFKYGETYRFGIQFQHKSGKWSEIIPIGDHVITTSPKKGDTANDSMDVILQVPTFKFQAQDVSSALSTIIKNGYIRARGVVVYPDTSERTVLCQGFVCPTVYNVEDRAGNHPFVQSSWFLRPNINYGNAETYDYGLQTNHNKPLFPTDEVGSELQTMSKSGTSGLDNPYPTNAADFVGKYGDFFYIDRSICTLHSPDIEFDESFQLSNLSGVLFRIVGSSTVRAVDWDVDITLDSPPFNNSVGGFLKFKNPQLNMGGVAGRYKPIASYTLYFDAHDRTDEGGVDGGSAAYPVYVWQRDGSLANAKNNRYGKLGKKKFSQLVFCNTPKYSSSTSDILITDAQIFNSNEVTPLKLSYSGALSSIYYYGNIDKLIAVPRTGYRKDGYRLTVSGWTDKLSNGGSNSWGYIDPSKAAIADVRKYIDQLNGTDYWSDNHGSGSGGPTSDNAVYYGIDPVRMKYKSSPHAVFTIKQKNSTTQYILPQNRSTVDTSPTYPTGAFWDSNLKGYESVTPPETTPQVNIWIGEFYRDSTPTFGGDTEEAYASNKWIPASEPVSIVAVSDGGPKDFTIEMKQGDTFFQRYDHLKTYPFTMEDQNSLVEIVSVMLETKINIDGRYDNNRGIPGLALSPTNFNLMNESYSQKNNFFPQQYVSKDRIEVDEFPSSVTWTKTKTLSEDIDTWTNITLASTLDLDGSLGKLRSMKLFNNEIIAFQDNAISNILFNSRTQINASDGIPIEIANSGKVDGKRYISNHIGTVNKFSIVETPLGLYFMDNNSSSIYQYNGSLADISDSLGFRSWCSENIKANEYDKSLAEIFTGHYDRSNSDIYFNNPNYSLGFSSLLNQFTSFYSYENIPFMFNVRNKFFSLRIKDGNTEVWEQNVGDYNYFYGEFKPFYTHIIANKDMVRDKIFNTLEFRADSYEGETLLNYDTFDRLNVWNEYQNGSSALIYTPNHPSSLQKKFRVWRANIPREDGKPLNRIRNTWTNLKLGKYTPNKLRTVLHDMTVHYTV